MEGNKMSELGEWARAAASALGLPEPASRGGSSHGSSDDSDSSSDNSREDWGSPEE